MCHFSYFAQVVDTFWDDGMTPVAGRRVGGSFPVIPAAGCWDSGLAARGTQSHGFQVSECSCAHRQWFLLTQHKAHRGSLGKVG